MRLVNRFCGLLAMTNGGVLFFVVLFCMHSSFGQPVANQNIYIKYKTGSVSIDQENVKALSPSMVAQQVGVKSSAALESTISRSGARQVGKESRYLKGIHKVQLEDYINAQDLLSYFRSFDNVEEVVLEPQVELLFVPNDTDLALQDYLALVQAYEAWDVTKGSEEVVIGISDSGVDYEHVDLLANRYFNIYDPINGLDDDGNGYVDDYIGFDLADLDNDPLSDLDPHGTLVAGVAAASTNNEIGIAGTGFNSKYFPIKVFSSEGGLSNGTYGSIIYAADLGLDVINLSWGGVHDPSSILQSIIDYAVLEKDMVVVAAAGNTDAELQFYPASYNHVLSVGASGDDDGKADFATYSFNVDLMAPGKGMYTTKNDDSYGTDSGSSYSAPMVSGTAALIRGMFPQLNAIQVMERIRMTTDDVYDIGNNLNYEGQLGKGRLNMLRAVSETNVASLRSYSYDYSGSFSQQVFFGDTATVNLSFVNILRDVSELKVQISTKSQYAEILNDEILIGAMSTFDSTTVAPVKILLANNTPANERIIFRMEYSDAQGYDDFQYFEFTTAPAEFTFENSNVEMVISSKGDLGTDLNISPYNFGLRHNGNRVANLMGLMIGNHIDSISDNLTLDYLTLEKDNDFQENSGLRYYNHAQADVYARNRFSDSLAENVNGFLIEQEFMAWEDEGNTDFIVTEYYIINTTSKDRANVKAGMFIDYYLNNPSHNYVSWDAANKLGYAYSDQTDGLMSGLALISDQVALVHAIDQSDENGVPIEIDNAITAANKYDFLNTEKTSAGGVDGQYVALSLAADIGTLEGKTSEKIAYALVFGYTLEELIENVNKAKSKYQDFLSTPGLNWVLASCPDVTVSLQNDDGIALYSDPLGLDLIDTGTDLSIIGFDQDSSFYYQELAGGYASDLYRLEVDIVNPSIQFRADPEVLFLNDKPTNRVQFVDESLGALEWAWDFDNGTFSTLKNPKISFSQIGSYEIQLSIVSSLGCSDVSTQTFEVRERGEAPIISDQLICAGDVVSISASNSTSLSFFQKPNDTNPFFEGEEWVSDPILTSQTYYVSSTAGAEESVKVPVFIEVDQVTSVFDYAQDTLDFSSSLLIALNDQSINSSSIVWEVNEIEIGSESAMTFDYTGLSELNIKQKAMSDLGCEDSLSVNLSLTESVKPGISEQEVCAWDEVTASPLNGTQFVFYSDVALQNIIAKGHQVTFGSITSDTTFYITNVTDFLESENTAFDIQVIDYAPIILASPDSLLFSVSPNANFSIDESAASYKWYLNEQLAETVASPTLTFDSLYTYQVSLISKNDLGCVDTSYLEYKVFEVLGLNEGEVFLSIFPNPAVDEIQIEYILGQTIQGLSVHNVMGQFFPVDFEESDLRTTVSIKSLAAGIYVLSGQINGQDFQQKFYKQ